MSRSLRLTPKVTLVFVVFAVLLLLGVGILAYSSGRSALQTATFSELLSVATEKEASFEAWVEDSESRVAFLANLSLVRDNTARLLSSPDPAEARKSHDAIVAELQLSTGGKNPFLTLFMLEPESGRIVASTDPAEEGRFKEDRPYFINGKTAPYVQNVYYSLELQAPAMTASAPIRAADGHLLGVLAGRLNLTVMSGIINRRTNLHQTEDAFMINPSNLFVTQPRFISDPAILRRGLYTDAVKSCLAGQSDTTLAEDYRGVPAILVFRWLPDRQLCLMVKIDQAEALEPSQEFGISLLGIGVVVLLIASVVAVGLASTIARPILALQSGVMQFGQGKLDVRLPETSTDELGLLAREFNTMAGAIAEKESLLQGYASDLEQRVAERQRAEAALAQERNLLRTLIDTLPDYIYVKDSLGRFVLNNTAHARLMGAAAPDEMVGKTDFDMFSKELADQYHADDQAVIQSGQPLIGREEPTADNQGNPKFVSTTKVPLRDPHGEVTGLVGITHDITERKQIEDQIRTLNAELEIRVAERTSRLTFLAEAGAVLSQSFDYSSLLKELAQLAVPNIADWCSVDILDEEGFLQRLAVVHTDPAKVEYAYELQRRYPPDRKAPRGAYHVIRTGQSEMIPEITDEMLVASIKDAEQLAIAQNLGLKSVMTVPLMARGQALGTLALVMAESGRLYGPDDLALAEDLARRAALLIENARLYYDAQQMNAKLEQRVAERTAQLESSNKELEAFSYSVSHDLRTPLRALDGFSQALQEDYGDKIDADGQDFLLRIRTASQQMGHLIDDLLNLSRLTRTEMRYESVDLGEMAQQIAASLRETQPERSVEFAIQSRLVVEGDNRLLHVMLVNLLSNAWKFTARTANARIEFGAISQNGTPVYFVRDNGAGFDMAYANKLFGAFQRLHKSSEFEGTGIGLATTQRIIQRHGGRIWAEAAVNRGATFYFSFQNIEPLRSEDGSQINHNPAR